MIEKYRNPWLEDKNVFIIDVPADKQNEFIAKIKDVFAEKKLEEIVVNVTETTNCETPIITADWKESKTLPKVEITETTSEIEQIWQMQPRPSCNVTVDNCFQDSITLSNIALLYLI